MKKILKEKINVMILFIMITIILLISMFPILHDDLLHASVGIGFNFMPHVNGRYLGNFFSINLAANVYLGIIIKSLIIILIVFLSKKILNIKNHIYILIFLILFMFMPKETFREVLPFTAGFSNYVIPIVGILFMIHSHLNNKFRNYKYIYIPLFLILGIFNSLFVEHITIFNLFLSFYFVVYEYIKTKKVNYIYCSYFIGSIFGTILMFTNPTYLVTLNGTDEYRSFSTFKEILKKPWSILRASLFHNLIINLLLIYIMTKIYIKEIQDKNIATIFSIIFLWCFGIYSVVNKFNFEFSLINNYKKHFEALLILMFIIFISYLLKKSKLLKKSDSYRYIFYLVSMILILAPLVLVSPLGPRCYIMIYILLCIFCVDLLQLIERYKIFDIKILYNITILIALLQMVFYIAIYGTIYLNNKERLNQINISLINKDAIIKILDLPYQNYLHIPNACSEYSELVFREYYNIPKNIYIKGECK